MNLKDTMLQYIRLCPLNTKNKLDIYNQFFLVLGNGYEWNDGELVDVYGNNKILTIEEAIENELLDEFNLTLFNRSVNRNIRMYDISSSECKEKIRERLKRYYKNIQTILHAEDIINHNIVINEDKRDFDFYSLTTYSAIMNIPDNVKPDWLDGIKELMDYLLNSDFPNVVDYRTKFENELNQVVERIENLIK
jgi:hypothetical protein